MYYDTDLLAKRVWLTMLNDFRTIFGPTFLRREEAAFLTSIPAFRQVEWREYGIVDPYKFKAKYQMENWLKKYRFRKDMYSDEELAVLTNTSYLDHQVALSEHRFTGVLTDRVLKRMREIITQLLGNCPNEEEIFSHVRFGRKSSIGCPLRNAYLDWKVTHKVATTSSTHGGEYFRKYLEGDEILRRLLQGHDQLDWSDPKFHHNSLSLVNVPKSWKTYRSITPLTLFDLFMSYGIGGVVQQRLSIDGIDITKAQTRHRRLMRSMSRHLYCATADLSRASDCITKSLLMRILPRKWWVLIRNLLTHRIIIDGKEFFCESVLPMGNGLTFPLETLVFYAFLKALSSLTGVKGLISVYGDDLIYPRRLHKYVSVMLPRLGFKLNLSKTYANFPFRESCGSDYYRGIDVRPAHLGGQHQMLRSPKYSSFLYKVFNTLARRWDIVELPQTFALLRAEITRVSGTVYHVPPSFPDTAGIKCDTPPHGDPHIKLCYVRKRGSWAFQFEYLAEVTRKLRVVRCTEIFYWDRLRDRFNDLDADESYTDRGSGTIFSSLGSLHREPARSPIIWRKCRTKTHGSRYDKVRMRPFTADRNVLDTVHQQATVTDWA